MNNSFHGCKSVLEFTFSQNTKGKSFKASLIAISAVIFAVMIAINVIYGLYIDDKNSETKANELLSEIHIIDKSGLENLNLENESIKVIAEETSEKPEDMVEKLESEEAVLVLLDFDSENNTYGFHAYTKAENTLDEDVIIDSCEYIADIFKERKQEIAGLDDTMISIVNNGIHTSKLDVTDEEEDIAVTLIKMFLPMIIVLFMYFVVLMYGQSIGKSVLSEKSSKLTETLMVLAKPNAIIFGKVLGMYLVAVMQTVVWIIAGVLGNVCGNLIAKSIFSDFESPINAMVELFEKEAADAFSIGAVIITVLTVFIGFLMYCVFAGLISSNIGRAEDLNNGLSVYSLVAVAGFLIGYMSPLMSVSESILNIFRFIPFTAAFMLPSDILVGNVSILSGVVSLSIMLATTMIMTAFTGKVYKKKMFG